MLVQVQYPLLSETLQSELAGLINTWCGRGEQQGQGVEKWCSLITYILTSAEVCRCFWYEFSTLYYLLNILTKYRSEKEETTKTCAKFGRLLFCFFVFFVFLCFKVLAAGVCVCGRVSAHICGDEENLENENRLKS